MEISIHLPSAGSNRFRFNGFASRISALHRAPRGEMEDNASPGGGKPPFHAFDSHAPRGNALVLVGAGGWSA
jgi:hypothetical protein